MYSILSGIKWNLRNKIANTDICTNMHHMQTHKLIHRMVDTHRYTFSPIQRKYLPVDIALIKYKVCVHMQCIDMEFSINISRSLIGSVIISGSRYILWKLFDYTHSVRSKLACKLSFIDLVHVPEFVTHKLHYLYANNMLLLFGFAYVFRVYFSFSHQKFYIYWNA